MTTAQKGASVPLTMPGAGQQEVEEHDHQQDRDGAEELHDDRGEPAQGPGLGQQAHAEGEAEGHREHDAQAARP